MRTIPLKTRLIKAGDDLYDAFLKVLDGNKASLKNGDVLVITSKVVSVCQGRTVNLRQVKTRRKKPSAFFKHSPYALALTELMHREADQVMDEGAALTLKDGCFIPAAGIDQSNAPDGMAILWPQDPFKAAHLLRQALTKHFNLRQLGILIIDSTCMPRRKGSVGLAIGWAGFHGVEDLRGKKDLYQKPLRLTQKAVADNLASAALLEMGESNERIPLIIFRGAPVHFTNRQWTGKEAIMPAKECIFRIDTKS